MRKKEKEDFFREFIEKYPSVVDKDISELKLLAYIWDLLDSFYKSTVTYDNNWFKIAFDDGQTFVVALKELKFK